MGIKLLAKIIP